jgi:hypothetical protein
MFLGSLDDFFLNDFTLILFFSGRNVFLRLVAFVSLATGLTVFLVLQNALLALRSSR